MSQILVILATPAPPSEDAANRLRHTLEALLALGHTVDLLVPAADTWPRLAQVRRFPLPRLPFCARLPDRPSARRCLVRALLLFYSVARLVSGRYDLIHAVDSGGLTARLAHDLTRTRYLIDLLPGDAPRWLHAAPYPWLERRALLHAEAVLANDPARLAPLTALGRRSRACLLPDLPSYNGEPSAPARNLAQARHRAGREQKLVACACDGGRTEDLKPLFQAILQVLETLPDTRFLVIGGDTSSLRSLAQTVVPSALDTALRLTDAPAPAERAALYAICDVLVAPLRTGETPPAHLLDFLQAEKPIVAIDTPAHRTLLSSENALLTRPEPDALATAVLRLLQDPVASATLAGRGRATLHAHNHTPDAFRETVRRCYEYALATRLL